MICQWNAMNIPEDIDPILTEIAFTTKQFLIWSKINLKSKVEISKDKQIIF